jgi:hypothetical protein
LQLLHHIEEKSTVCLVPFPGSILTSGSVSALSIHAHHYHCCALPYSTFRGSSIALLHGVAQILIINSIIAAAAVDLTTRVVISRLSFPISASLRVIHFVLHESVSE